MRTRRNPSSGTILTIGAVLLALGLVAHAASKASQPSPVSVSGIVIPSDIASQMWYVWTAAGRPMDSATWVQLMRPLVPSINNTGWAKIYSLFVGFYQSNGVGADNATVYRWVTQAAGG